MFKLGITHAGVWAAMSSLIAHNTDPELRTSTQGFLQGVHHGFGKFCGAVFGGMLIQDYGKILIIIKSNEGSLIRGIIGYIVLIECKYHFSTFFYICRHYFSLAIIGSRMCCISSPLYSGQFL